MFIFIIVILVGMDRLAITYTGHVNPFPRTDIPQVTRPAARSLHIQNKSIVLNVIRAIPGHAQIRDKFAAVQFKQMPCASIVRLEIQRASVCAAYGSGCE